MKHSEQSKSGQENSQVNTADDDVLKRTEEAKPATITQQPLDNRAGETESQTETSRRDNGAHMSHGSGSENVNPDDTKTPLEHIAEKSNAQQQLNEKQGEEHLDDSGKDGEFHEQIQFQGKEELHQADQVNKAKGPKKKGINSVDEWESDGSGSEHDEDDDDDDDDDNDDDDDDDDIDAENMSEDFDDEEEKDPFARPEGKRESAGSWRVESSEKPLHKEGLDSNERAVDEQESMSKEKEDLKKEIKQLKGMFIIVMFIIKRVGRDE